MKTVRFADFVAGADHYRELAQVETIVVTDDDGAPQFVVMPHEVYKQLRKGNRQALNVSELGDDELRDVGDAAVLGRYDWPDDDEPAGDGSAQAPKTSS